MGLLGLYSRSRDGKRIGIRVIPMDLPIAQVRQAQRTTIRFAKQQDGQPCTIRSVFRNLAVRRGIYLEAARRNLVHRIQQPSSVGQRQVERGGKAFLTPFLRTLRANRLERRTVRWAAVRWRRPDIGTKVVSWFAQRIPPSVSLALHGIPYDAKPMRLNCVHFYRFTKGGMTSLPLQSALRCPSLARMSIRAICHWKPCPSTIVCSSNGLPKRWA